jgi:hypothetical protein
MPENYRKFKPSSLIIYILIGMLIAYIGAFYAMCLSGRMCTFLRSEASYSIFVFIQSGDARRTESLFVIFKPMIYIDGMIMRLMQWKLNYENNIGLYVNVDKHEEERKFQDLIDNTIKNDIDELSECLYHGDGRRFVEYCDKNGIAIRQGRDDIIGINRPLGKITSGVIASDNKDDRDYVNFYKVKYFRSEDKIKGFKYYIESKGVIKITGIDAIYQYYGHNQSLKGRM